MNNQVEENEAFIERRLDDPGKAEARGWLRRNSEQCRVSLGELGPAESLALVDRFYEAGAIEVVAVEIDKYPAAPPPSQQFAGENTGILVIVLPEGDAAARRAEVLDLCGDVAEEQGFGRPEDFGQRRVFLMLD